MAAPMSLRVFQMRQAVSRLWTVSPQCCCGLQLQQARHMAKRAKKHESRNKGLKAKGSGTSVKAQVVAEVWKPLSQRMEKQEKVMPTNWDEFLKREPTDDIWIRSFYPKPRHSLVDVLAMHRELASPEMTDNMTGMLHMDCELNMKTKKKTKFLGNIKSTVLLPHRFDDGIERHIMAFCKTQEEKEKALELGAVIAGGVDLIKSIQCGEVYHEDFDHVVCTMEMLPEVTAVRKFLKDGFPHKNKGNLSTNLEEMMHFFKYGQTYSSTKESEAVAKLDMPTEHLQENFIAIVEALSGKRDTKLGRFVTSAIIRCPPSAEKLKVLGEELVPPSQSKPKESTSKKIEKELPEEEEDDDVGEAAQAAR